MSFAHNPAKQVDSLHKSSTRDLSTRGIMSSIGTFADLICVEDSKENVPKSMMQNTDLVFLCNAIATVVIVI